MSAHASDGTLSDYAQFLPHVFFNGFRFDAQIASYALCLFFFLALPTIFTPIGYSNFICRAINVWTGIAASLLTTIGLADIVFYANFKCHFNNVTFDFLDEEPLVIARGVWEESPILTFLLVVIVVGVAAYYVMRRLSKLPLRLSRTLQIATPFVTLMLLFLMMRGSLRPWVLNAEDIYVSPSTTLNDCVPNGTFMLKKAYSEHKKQFRLPTAEDLISEADMSLAEALNAWADSSAHSPADALFRTSTPNPPCAGSDVLIVLTESWSNRLIDYEQMFGLDLLGAMRQHFNSDILFRHFLSSTQGTINALESITISCPFPEIFTSQWRTTPLPSATARTFSSAGYETFFVSGIRLSWRNIGEALPAQGFDHVVGQYELLAQRPDAQCNTTWGVYDHDMLRYVSDILCEPHSKPRFILALTSTSHPPFEFPSDYPFADLSYRPAFDTAFARPYDVTLDYLRGYAYESNELGLLMNRIKSSSRADSIVVCLTGDHNIRSILPYGRFNNVFHRYSVPVYFYAPHSGMPSRIDTTTCGSHADIVPSLVNLCLPSTTYFAVGQDVFAISDSLPSIGFNTDGYVISRGMSSESASRKASALTLLKKLYFQSIFTAK